MQKLSVYRGIEYVRVSELPEEQRLQIENWLSHDVVIKIQMKDKLLTDCVLYKDYCHWYENIFTKLSLAEEEVAVKNLHPKSKPISGLAFE